MDRRRRSWWDCLVAAEYNVFHLLAVSGFAGIACFVIARASA